MVNLLDIFRKPFYKNACGWILLKLAKMTMESMFQQDFYSLIFLLKVFIFVNAYSGAL